MDPMWLQRAQAKLAEGHRLFDTGDFTVALAHYEECRACGEAIADEEQRKHVLGPAIGMLGAAYLSLGRYDDCLLYTSPSPRDRTRSRMPSSA